MVNNTFISMIYNKLNLLEEQVYSVFEFGSSQMEFKWKLQHCFEKKGIGTLKIPTCFSQNLNQMSIQ